MYQLLYHPDVPKKLKKIHKTDYPRILSKLEKLAKNPKDDSLSIKKLASTKNSYRLRVGNLRIIFEPDHVNKKIFIWDIDYRGSIY